MKETTCRSNISGVIPHFQDPLVELGPLLVTHLAHLRDLPPDVVRVPRAKSANMPLFSAPGVLSLP